MKTLRDLSLLIFAHTGIGKIKKITGICDKIQTSQHQEKVLCFNMHVTDANMHVLAPSMHVTAPNMRLTMSTRWQI